MNDIASREAVGMQALQDPDSFPSLPKRSEVERQLMLWYFPSFGVHSSWTLYKSFREKTFVVRRLEHDPQRGFPSNVKDPHIFGSEGSITEEIASELIARLEGLSVPMFRRPAFIGMDGAFYGVHLGNLWQGTRVNWWSHGDSEWQPLVQFFEHAVKVFESVLPASTLRESAP